MSLAAPRPRPKNLYPHGLHLPFIALGGSLAPALACTSSLEIRSKATPPPRPARVHSQEHAPFGPTVPLPGHVPPSWFLTTLTAYSARRAMGLLHPTPGQGFTTFHASQHPTCTRRLRWCPAGTPRSAVHTLRSLSLVSSRTASLQPLPSCRSVNTTTPQSELRFAENVDKETSFPLKGWHPLSFQRATSPK
jgi:hypothetical protein